MTWCIIPIDWTMSLPDLNSPLGNLANNLARDTYSWPDDEEDEDEDELDCQPDVLFLVKSPPRSSS